MMPPLFVVGMKAGNKPRPRPLHSTGIFRNSLVFLGLVVSRVHVPFKRVRKVELALLNLLAGGRQHWLG